MPCTSSPSTDPLDEPFGSLAPNLPLAVLMKATRAMPNNWFGKRLAFALRRLGLAMVDRASDIEALGVRFRLYPFDNVCERRILFTPQLFDPVERSLLAERIHSDFVFVDAGANIGAYSLFVAARAGPGAKIIAIEPQPIVFERLVRNIRENPIGTIKAIGCALADRDGELTLFLDGHNRGESSVKYLRPEGRAAGEVVVPARTLLGILREEHLDHVDALKLDVEGSEDLVLEPFLQAAPRALLPRLIVVEKLPDRWPADLSGLLDSHGYRILATTKTNVVMERER